MATIAWLGLGQMGTPMAKRLVEAGHDLAVWNRTAAKTQALVEAGGRAAGSPAAAADGAEIVVTMLSTPDAVREVLFGVDGAVARIGPGSVVIEMSTSGLEARGFAEMLPDGVELVDAPVQGSIGEATDGSLRIHVGGSEEAFKRVRPVLEVMGEPRRYGPVGAGAAMKLVMNSTLGGVLIAFAEAFALGRALGLDQDALLDNLELSPVARPAGQVRGRLERDDWSPRFKLSLATKDMRLVREAAKEVGVEMRSTEAALSRLEQAEPRFGDSDYTSLTRSVARI
jgi:3-hydroxyisobutyrate dehydrogenase-like beta-hydroxyacid dehydrogenase